MLLRAGLLALLAGPAMALLRHARARPLELSRKVSRTQLNMRMGYAQMTIVKTGKRKREGLVQAHPFARRQPAEADPDGTRQRHCEAQWLVKTIAR